MAITFPIPTFDPKDYIYDNNSGQPPQIPNPSTITPQDVRNHLRNILRVSRQQLINFQIYAFVSQPSGVMVTLNQVRHYYEMISLFEIVIAILKKDHPGAVYTKKTIRYRDVYYKWKKLYKGFYKSPYVRYNDLFKDFINIIGLPICFLRIRAKSRGLFMFPGTILRYDDTGQLYDGYGQRSATGQRCTIEPRDINEEWMCRMFGVNVKRYRTSLTFKFNNSAVQDKTALFVEKNTVFDRLFMDDVHVDNNCIINTGCGFPGVSTRAFNKYITEYFSTPNAPFRIQALTDLGQTGASIIQSLSYQERPMHPHSHFNIEPLWMGLNYRFMSTAFPDITYVSRSSAREDSIINNMLLDTTKGFVTETINTSVVVD